SRTSCISSVTQSSTRVWSSGITGPVACAINARSGRPWPFPKRRGITAGCVGSRWGCIISVTLIGACRSSLRGRFRIRHRPWQPNEPTIFGQLGSGYSAPSWGGEIITGHYLYGDTYYLDRPNVYKNIAA